MGVRTPWGGLLVVKKDSPEKTGGRGRPTHNQGRAALMSIYSRKIDVGGEGLSKLQR